MKSTRSSGSPAGGAHRLTWSRRGWKAGQRRTSGSSMASDPWPVIDRRMGRADTIVYVDLPLRTHLWWAAKRQVLSLVRGQAWAGQSAPPSSLLLFRTLRRVHAMRSDLLDLVTKDGRGTKLVQLRSAREIAR